MKDAQKRIDSTIDAIVDDPQVPLGEKANVRKFLVAKAGEQTQTTVARDNFSAKMSMKDATAAGDKTDRMRRRECFLMRSVLSAGGADIKTVGATELSSTFGDLVFRLRVAADQAYSGQGILRNIFMNRLKSRPLDFVTNFRLTVKGSSARDGSQGDRNVLQYHFCYDSGTDTYLIQPDAIGKGSHGFSAVSVTAVGWSKVPNRGTNKTAGSFADIAGIELDGADVMVTTQFTGCSMCFKKQGGKLLAAHIAPTTPDGPLGGGGLADQLLGNVPTVTKGDFANGRGGGTFYVYGMTKSNLPGHPNGYSNISTIKQMCIFGIEGDDGWKFFAQEQSTTGTITAHDCIYSA